MTCPRSYGKKQVTALIVYSSPTGHRHARNRVGDAHRGQLLPAPRHPDQITATMTTNPPPDARNARI